MPLISQEIVSILDGISQQPDKLRSQSEGEAQLNMYDSLVEGKTRRPPTTHIAKLSNTPATFQGEDGWYIWPVNRDSVTQYQIIVNAGAQTIQVFDGLTGQQYPVLTPQGTSYLEIQSAPSYNETFTQTDLFAGTNGTTLAHHLSPEGVTWNLINGQIDTSILSSANTGVYTDIAVLNGANAVEVPSDYYTSAAGYIYNYPLSDANYSASIEFTVPALFTGTDIALGIRCVAPASTSNYLSGYIVSVADPGPGQSKSISLYRASPTGSPATLGVYTTGTWSQTTYTLGITANGTTISASLNGTTIITATDTTYTAAGYVAVLQANNQNSSGNPQPLSNFNLTYTETVTPPTPTQYGFRFATVQDTTFIANQSVNVQPKAGVYTPLRPPEALIAIRQIDFGTNYNVTINGITFGYSTSNPNTVDSRQQITSDSIAQELYSQIVGAAGPLAGLFASPTTQIFGSTIYLTTTDGSDFTISVSDGLTDNAIVAIKNNVQSQELLPPRALNGFVVEVQPDPDNQYDATYYIYDDLGQPSQNGIWRECAAPGTLTTLDPLTMPWTITKQGNVVAGFPADGGPTFKPSIIPESLGTGHTTYYAVGSHCLGDNGASTSITLDSNATGAYGETITVNYSLFMVGDSGPDGCSAPGSLPNSEYVTVQVTDSSQPGKTFTKNYYGGTSYPNESISFLTQATSGATITVTLFYSRQSTPPADHQIDLYIHIPTDATAPGIQLTTPNAQLLTFNSQQTYPQGLVTTLTIAGTPYTYTSPVDQSYTEYATALQSHITATGYTLTNPAPGELLIEYTGGTGAAPTVTYSNNWNTNQDYHNGSLELAPGELVGYVIQNLTDGSSGIITANTSTTITVGAGLSGGLTNAFLKNNLVSVTGPADSLFFVFQPVNWTPRGVGDDVTNPFPSFTYGPIQEIGYASGRLLVTAGESLVATGSNDDFNFFRTTVVSLLDSDRIDVQSNTQQVSNFHSIVNWAEGTWLWAGNVQAQLPTQPSLSNATISIQPQTAYQSSPNLRPLSMDRRVYFARERTGDMPYTQIFTYQRIRFPFFGFIAQEATKKLPKYMIGQPLLMVGDPTLEIMLVLTDQNGGQQNVVYVYIFHYDEQQQLQQESWSTWELDPRATILGMDMLDGHLGLIVSRPDGVYYEDMDLQLALYNAQ